MNSKIFLLYFTPILFSLILAGPKKFKEKTITNLTSIGFLIPALTSVYILTTLFISKNIPFEESILSLNLFGHLFEFVIWIDQNSILLLILTHLLGFLVLKYSHGYLHLEKGFQRYFATILLFIFGMYLIGMAGTMDMFFAGWEIVGISSFFLISFYRAHNRSVINAWRIYNIYRVCDVGLLLGAVLGHILWHEASRFSVILSITPEKLMTLDQNFLSIISLFIILASLGKSAQFPFHNWPSKAMEGPTPSSAIFYGALSIHAGVFLLIRTHPLWGHLTTISILVGSIGATTLILSTLQGRIQSNIKGQIAYASTAQIGIMFIELALGLTQFAMIHLFCHALYRCFQLLISPSIVANSLTQNTISKQKQSFYSKNPIYKKIETTLYTLAMNDFSLDVSWRGFNFIPWREGYTILKSILNRPVWSVMAIMLISPLPSSGLSGYISSPKTLPAMLSSSSLFFSLRALLIHHNAFKVMLTLSISLILDMIAAYVLTPHSLISIGIYMGSLIPFMILALIITKQFDQYNLQNFHALGTENPLKANLFLLSFMVISGMPISFAFFGEDILLEEIIGHSHLMAFFTSLSFMINGLVCVKIYTRLFMGCPAKEESDI